MGKVSSASLPNMMVYCIIHRMKAMDSTQEMAQLTLKECLF